MTTYLDTAVDAVGRDAGVPWHYGDPLREQRKLVTSAAVIDRGNRDVVVVSGEERLAWLHSICSQHVSALADGDSTQALVLSPNGHVEQHWQVTELDGQVWLDTEPGAGPQVLAYLRMMQFLKRVDPVDASAEWAVLSLVGPASDTVLQAAGLLAPREVGRATALPGGGFLRRMPPLADDGVDAVDIVVPRDRRAGTLGALVTAGAQPAGLWAYEAIRVQARTPRIGLETDHRTIPHEIGWIGSAVHLDKGCYRGQETVARVHNLGRPPRQLVLIHFGGESDELPDPGTPVVSAGRAVGFVGTAVHHHELGPIALAVVKRSLAESGSAQLLVQDRPVAIDADRPKP